MPTQQQKPSQKKELFIPETQLSSLLQDFNINELNMGDKQAILKELIKNMSVAEMYQSLVVALDGDRIIKLGAEIKQRFHEFDDRIICETDPEDMDKDSTTDCPLATVATLPESKKTEPNILQKEKMQERVKCSLLHPWDPTKFLVTFTRLPSNPRKKIEEFCELFGVSLTNNIEKKCTHLIMLTDDRCEINRNSYTFKYIFALASKMFIVRVLESLKQGVLLNEDSYEVKSDRLWGESLTPNIARTSSKFLFDGTCVIILSNFDDFHLTKDQIVSVLTVAKATVKTSVENLGSFAHKYQNIIAVLSKDKKELDDETSKIFKKYTVKVIDNETLVESMFYYQF
ncbi:hypothetical protein MXB_2145 [Myxobolus squamalis]|nr:hypothetical protein MXB_2145 [Myxobolus squamalis]